MSLELARRRFTVAEYHRMAEARILGADDRVELIDGEVVELTPISSRHAACVKRLNRWFSRELSGRALVSVQDPVRLDDLSEPEPDVALLEPRDDSYERSHPGPGDILLLVEVAGSSLEYDRDVKIPLYARAGVREVWLVDLDERVIDVYRARSPSGYRSVNRAAPGDRLAPEALPDLVVEVSEIIGG